MSDNIYVTEIPSIAIVGHVNTTKHSLSWILHVLVFPGSCGFYNCDVLDRSVDNIVHQRAVLQVRLHKVLGLPQIKDNLLALQVGWEFLRLMPGKFYFFFEI